MRLALTLVMVTCSLALGCGGDDEPILEPPSGCPPGAWQREDGVCISPGLPPDMPCPPGEWLRDGVCIPAGVPPDGCDEAFVHDGDRGCDPILPREPCAPGLIAVPGDAMCREVAPCAPGNWGDIPVEADTEYVDASYAGMDSDGTAPKPWTSIQAAVDAALAGAIVAIAEGSYLEDVTISGKPVRLWGVCPALVEVVATGAELAALEILDSATEVRSLSIRGDAVGVWSSGSLDVLIERVWVHDTTRGVEAQSQFGPTGTTLRASLIEHCNDAGVFVAGAEMTLEASVVRNTQPNAQQLFGRGVNAKAHQATSVPSTLLLRTSLVEQSREFGVLVDNSQATLEASVVRDTQPNTAGILGNGVLVEADPATGTSTLLLRASLVEQSHELGVSVIGSQATLEASVVRDTRPDTQGKGGHGVTIMPDTTASVPSTLLIHTSLVEQSYGIGVYAAGSEATLEASVVRYTQPNMQARFGRGVNVEADATTGAPSTLLLHASLVEQNHDAGVFVAGSVATVDATVVRTTQPDVEGLFGRGVSVQSYPTTGAPSTLLLRASLVEQNYQAGVALRASVGTIESTLVRDSMTDHAGFFGDGVMVLSDELGAASATLTATRVERSARAGMGAHGAYVAIADSAFTCQAFDLDTETYKGKTATLVDQGGNLCGCPDPTATCAAVSANLEPPPPQL